MEGPTYVCGRYKSERAAHAGRAAQLDFATQQARQFAADGQTQTGAAVFAARPCVRLLKRLEDDALFFGRDTDAGIGNFEGDDRRRAIQIPDGPRSSRSVATLTESRTLPCSVNLNAFESRFFSTCCKRFESVTRLRVSAGSVVTSKSSRRFSASCRNGRAIISSRLAKNTSSASTETVPDSIFERSRMSLIRFSKSVPAPWMVRANSTCLGVRLPSGLSVSCWPKHENAVERRTQLVRHVGQEFRLVLGGKRQLLGLFFQRAARLLDFLVLAFHFDVLLGELLRFLRQLLVGLLQFFLLRLQLGRQLLRLFQQAFGLHRGFDAVQHDADAGGELFQEGEMRSGEYAQ